MSSHEDTEKTRTTTSPSESIKRRFGSLFAVLLIAITIGIPLWFKTTSIHRSVLPEIAPEPFNYAIHVGLVDVPLVLEGIHEDIQSEVNEALPQMPDNTKFSFVVNGTGSGSAYKLKMVLSDDESPSYAVSTGDDRLIKMFVTDSLIASGQVPRFIAQVLVNDIFGDEIQELVQPAQNDIKIHYHPKIIISISLLRSNGSSLTWNLNSPGFKKFVNFIKLIEQNGFAKFQIETQEDWYDLRVDSPNSSFEDDHGRIVINDTSTFIDYSGWALDQNVGIEPNINFVIYHNAGQDLILENSLTNSFLVPQWGGVVLQNSPLDHDETRMAEIMDIFASQLFQLLGSSSASTGSLYYRIDYLVRRQTRDNYLRSIANVQSLDKLTKQLNTIPIPEETIQEINEACAYLAQANRCSGPFWWILSNESSSRALHLSDKAFFQKDMIQQNYFPDEHKTAVYSPLLGPFGTIMFMAFVRLFKEFRGSAVV